MFLCPDCAQEHDCETDVWVQVVSTVSPKELRFIHPLVCPGQSESISVVIDTEASVQDAPVWSYHVGAPRPLDTGPSTTPTSINYLGDMEKPITRDDDGNSRLREAVIYEKTSRPQAEELDNDDLHAQEFYKNKDFQPRAKQLLCWSRSAHS